VSKALARRAGALLLLVASLGATAAESLDALIARADALRTADPPRLRVLLHEIDARAAQAAPAQRDHIGLLHAYAETFAGDYDAALARARRLSSQAGDPDVKFRATLFVANVSARPGGDRRGVQYLGPARRQEDKVQPRELGDLGHGVAATLYTEFGQPDLALRFSEDGLANADRLAPRQRCMLRANRLQALQALGRQFDEQREAAPAIAECQACGEGLGVALVRSSLAQQWIARGRRAEALGLLDAALADVRGNGYTVMIALLQGLRAQTRLDVGDLDGAVADARAVLGQAGDRPGWRPRVVAYDVLYRVAERRHQPAQALAYYKAFADADRARTRQLQVREAAYQLGQHQLRERTESLAQLASQNQMLRLRGEVEQRRAWNFRLAAALLAVITLGAAVWGWRARRTHRSLRELADTDTLTGLGNRRHFRACAERVLADARARGRPVALVLFDLDHFKQINDRCGHAVGDRVLAAVARAVTSVAPQAVHGRLGGEEFAFVLRDCDAACAAAIAERCRAVIHAIDLTAQPDVPVSASLGVASTQACGYDFEALVSQADAAMYAAKAGGRDRVVVAPADGSA